MQKGNELTFVISWPLLFILTEDYGFGTKACEDMPNCNCGHVHLIPPPEMLLQSEFIEDEEAAELERRIKEGLKEQEELAVETLELLEARAFYDAAELRAQVGLRLDDDPPPELFNT